MLEWDHNAYYHQLLLDQLPPHGHRVLDIGCGAGAFATQLAHRVEQVDAVDRSAAMIELARQRTPDNVNCILADVLTDPLPAGGYDAIFSMCSWLQGLWAATTGSRRMVPTQPCQSSWIHC